MPRPTQAQRDAGVGVPERRTPAHRMTARPGDRGDEGRPDRLLTVDELAERWRVSPRTIRRKIDQKQIPVIRIGRSVRIHPSVAEIGPEETV